MELHKLTNLDTAYLQILTLNSSRIYNVATGFCLTHDFDLAVCDPRKPHGFILVNNQIAIPSGNQVESMVYSHVPPHYFDRLRTKCGHNSNFCWER